jgi:hypothetical protein
MYNNLPLPQDKKLTVLFRVEPGCLGPEGINHVDRFCEFVGDKTDFVETNYIHMDIVPRHDKALPEIEFRVGNKLLSHAKAEKYLALFDEVLDDFEMSLYEGIAKSINQYFER